jgi:precorrin-6Y C5,15-methyltransferase (decarboxylating)
VAERTGDPAVAVVGVPGDRLDTIEPRARRLLAGARRVAGGRRHLGVWRAWLETATARQLGAGPVPTIEIGADADAFAQQVAFAALDRQEPVCVLASGDPGFFGILRALLRVLDRHRLEVIPAPSSVALAFGRLGLPWDDATVVSAHGRPLDEAVRAVRLARKAAVLTSPTTPPEALARELLAGGLRMDLVAVCSRLGSEDEAVEETSLEGLAARSWDPLSVVVLVGPGGLRTLGWDDERSERSGPARPLAWGLPDAWFAHRGGMVTKAEIRAVVLGKLALPPAGVLWDLGAGSGSVSVEAARLCPGLSVFAVEADPEDATRITANAQELGAAVHVITGRAPEALGQLPDPDRVFVGGGGTSVLEVALGRLRPAGRVVATYAAIDRALAAADRLGSMAQLGLSRGQRLPDGAWRLAAENPVFVAWGPADGAEVPGERGGAPGGDLGSGSIRGAGAP